jgi:hypothetical protein
MGHRRRRDRSGDPERLANVFKNGIIIRDTGSGPICAVMPGVEGTEDFLAVATAALLGGKTVTIERGGALNGQYKCYQIAVRR